jgi:hypothetical protein
MKYNYREEGGSYTALSGGKIYMWNYVLYFLCFTHDDRTKTTGQETPYDFNFVSYKIEIRYVVEANYSIRRPIACFKATEGLHPPYREALSQQYSVASFATLRVLSCLRCDLKACNAMTANITAVLTIG